MSVIQDIRDKYAKWAVVAIALSLVGFILMDAFTGRSNMFGNNSTTVGSINGKNLEFADFENRVKEQEDLQRQQQQDPGPEGRKQIIESVWNDEIATKLINDESEELGIVVTTKEMNDFLFGSNPPQDFRQRFVDSATGGYDALAAQQAVNQMKRTARPEDREQFARYLNSLKLNRKAEKYTSLLINSVYVPKWIVEKQNADNALMAKAAFVSVPYTTISDSAIKITDEEIEDYVENHKKLFEVKEETRAISYVTFNATPNAADSNAVRATLESRRVAFDTASDYEAFAVQNNSPMGYYGGFISKNTMRQANKDAILSAPVGVVYGPYVDQGQGTSFMVMSKILEARTLPDTVKVRHILIATAERDPQTGTMREVRDTASARNLADSIRGLIAAGQPFDSLAARYSDDPGSKDKGGVYENVTTGQMSAEFNNFSFTRRPGEIGIVKTEYGYHIIEVMSQKGASTAYRIAYFSAPIVASQETDNAANSAASSFAGESTNEKQFNENYEKKLKGRGITKMLATNIKPNDYSIQSLGSSREFVKAIFEADEGDVLQPERVGEAYVVAVVTSVDEAGLQSAKTARQTVEPILRNKKKATQIKQKIGKISTLEAAAAATGQPVTPVDSLRFAGSNPVLGFEAKVIGAAFNPDNKGRVVPEAIEGQTGVFVLRVDAVSAVANPNANVEQQRQALRDQQRQQVNPMEGLKAGADIKDNRAKFY